MDRDHPFDLRAADASPQLRSLLREGETIRWHDRPRPGPIYLQHLIVGFVLAFFVGPFVTMFALIPLLYGGSALLAFTPLILFGAFLFAVIGSAKLRVDHAEYAVTNERLIQFGGVIGRDFSAIRWENVRDVEVRVGVFDKPFGTGAIQHTVAGVGGSSGSAGVKFAFVRDPYGEFKKVAAIQDAVEAR